MNETSLAIHKEIFNQILNSLRPNLYNILITSNRNIIEGEYNLNGSGNIVDVDLTHDDLPLWMMSGGEAVNLYSGKYVIPTKDLDIKLLFSDRYNIPKKLFELIRSDAVYDGYLDPDNIQLKLPQIFTDLGFNISEKDFNTVRDSINAYCDGFEYAFKFYAKELTLPVWESYTLGIKSRKDVLKASLDACYPSLINNKDKLPHYICPISHDDGSNILQYANENIPIHSIHDHFHSDSTKFFTAQDSTKFKLYMLAVPYINSYLPNNEFPFAAVYGEITIEYLTQLEEQLNRYYTLTEDERTHYFELWYNLTSVMASGDIPLCNMYGVAIAVTEDGRAHMMTEAFLDLYMDFSVSDTLPGEKRFNNLTSTGMIPNIVHNISYCGNVGHIRLTTYTWILHDSFRMLYLHLRGEGPREYGMFGIKQWGEKVHHLNKSLLYLNKNKALISAFIAILKNIEQTLDTKTGVEDIQTFLQGCNNEIDCIPSKFIMFLIQENSPLKIEDILENYVCGTGDVHTAGKSKHTYVKKHTKKTRPNTNIIKKKTIGKKYKNKDKHTPSTKFNSRGGAQALEWWIYAQEEWKQAQAEWVEMQAQWAQVKLKYAAEQNVLVDTWVWNWVILMEEIFVIWEQAYSQWEYAHNHALLAKTNWDTHGTLNKVVTDQWIQAQNGWTHAQTNWKYAQADAKKKWELATTWLYPQAEPQAQWAQAEPQAQAQWAQAQAQAQWAQAEPQAQAQWAQAEPQAQAQWAQAEPQAQAQAEVDKIEKLVKKEIFVNMLDTLRPIFYDAIISSNEEILNSDFNLNGIGILYNNEFDDLPLWSLSGGEVINLYSGDNLTKTKDIDLKLMFSERYSIPKDTFNKNHTLKLPLIYNYKMEIDIAALEKEINDEAECKKKFGKWDKKTKTCYETNAAAKQQPPPDTTFTMFNDDGFGFPSEPSARKKVTDFLKIRTDALEHAITKVGTNQYNTNIWKLFNFGISARKKLLQTSMNSYFNTVITMGRDPRVGSFKHLCPISNDGSNGLKYADEYIPINSLNEHFISDSTNFFTAPDVYGTQFKIYMFTTPFIFAFKQGGQFPYNLPESTGDVNSITDLELNVINEKLNTFYSLEQKDREIVFDLWYDSHVLFKLGFPLMNITGVALIILANGQKYIISEGLMDIYFDFSSSFKTQGDINFNNYLPSGAIPTLVQKINYCVTEGRETVPRGGNIRIPTYHWLLYDQIKMLYQHLRGEQPEYYDSSTGEDGYGNIGVIRTRTVPNTNPKKYINKINGMLENFLKILDKLAEQFETEGGIDAMRNALQQCTDEHECVPSKFLMYLNNINNVFNQDSLIKDIDCKKLAIYGKKKRVKSIHKKKKHKKKRYKNTQKTLKSMTQ